MSKKRKTRKEKMAREIKLQSSLSSTQSSSPVYSFSYTSPKNTHSQILQTHTTVIPSHYSYVKHDIKQTMIITGALLAFSVALYTLIQTKVINLAIFGY